MKTTFDFNTTNTNAKFIKQAALSASFYFSHSLGCKKLMRNIVTNRSNIQPVNTLEDLREALHIHIKPWTAFLAQLSKDGGVIRHYNGHTSYHNCKTDNFHPNSPFHSVVVPTGSNPAPTGSSPASTWALEDKIKDLEALVSKLQNGDNEENKKRVLALLSERKKLVKEIEELKAANANTLVLTSPEGHSTTLNMVHKNMKDILVRINAGLNVWLVGPAGSGKTTAAEQVADSLCLDFGMMSVGPQTTKSDIFGYMSATGDYVTTVFRKCFEHGGLFLFDEMDAAHPGVLTAVNAALAGNLCAFPDGMIEKHEDFYCIAAGNTYGTGPDRQYVGRQELDAASLDRFDFVEFGYDESLEEKIVLSIATDKEAVKRYFNTVIKIRRAIEKVGIRHIVSPRASINGTKLINAGLKPKEFEMTTIWKGLKPDEIKRIKAAC